jgi:hypothetical protein
LAKENEQQDARIEQLGSELQALSARVAQLEVLLAAGRHSEAAATPATTSTPAAPGAPAAAPAKPKWQDYAIEEPEDVSEEILDWAGKAHLLTRLSTLCFLLVVALGLRTVTDNNLINTLAGSMIGMGYAAALMIAGAWRYSKKSPLAPILAASGAVLMCSIVVETHARFAALPLVPAYLTLIATGVGMAWVSHRYRSFLPISLGTLGMCLAGAAIDYPHPYFPYLALVLFAANILGYFAAQLKSCSWLRWIVLVVSMAMLQLWAVRLGMILLGHQQPPSQLAGVWFLPALAAFSALFLALAFTGIVRDTSGRISRFNFALPTLNAVWAFSAACYLIHASGGSKQLLGLLGVALAIGHLVVTFWLAGRKEGGAPGTNSFAFAGAALAAVALPFAAGKFTLSLPALSVLAFFLAIMSRKWQNGGIRATSYLVQFYAVVALAVALQMDKAEASDLVNALPAGLLALITLYQYQWCRQYPPPEASVFSRFDAGDRSAVALLLCSLASGFFMLRVAVLQALTLYAPPAEVANAFGCSQSILINASAAGIMLFAFFRRNKEVRNVAILVTLIGALKVFLYDLLSAHGVPLVASVFTFGLAAAIESVALGRWQKNAESAAPEVAEAPKGPIAYGTPLASVVPEKTAVPQAAAVAEKSETPKAPKAPAGPAGPAGPAEPAEPGQ